VLILLFGAKRIPEMARILGRSIGEFRAGQREGADLEPDRQEPPKAAPADGPSSTRPGTA
jgi:TatA/E family protein of Tat protein translocase